MPVSSDECAREVLEVVPLVMRTIRTEIRRQRGPDLSVPQFRTLAFLNHRQRTSLSEAADHIGLALPSMSKLVDGLVTRRLVVREPCSEDRRRITLGLTEAGGEALRSARELAQAYLAQALAPLPEADRATVTRAMQILRPVFTPPAGRK